MTMIMGLMLAFASGPTFAAEKKYKIIFIVKSLDNPFWDRMRAGAEKAGEDLGIEIKTLAPIKPYNVEEQLRFMEDGITQKVDAICVVPADSKGIVPGIEKANKAGIPVVTPNSRAFGGKVMTWTGAHNRDVGYDIAKYAINAIGGKGNPGVAANVKKIVGTIGYVDLADAQKNNMNFVALKNKAGSFVLPSQKTIAAAAGGADFKVKGMAPDLLDQTAKNAWPITTATFVLAYEKGGDAAKQKAVVDFFTWSLNQGQKMAEQLGFVALPGNVVKMVETEMKKIK
jgi:ABC-type sugar transport system substrate-binding protein